MKKEITLGTKITFNATGDKYSISEQTATGFQFKPIKFEKGLPTVPRTFEEVKDEFLSSQIDIEGFEHNEADDCLVSLLMEGYIKASDIESLKELSTNIASEKGNLETQLTENSELLKQKEITIQEHLVTIENNNETIKAHEATINEQNELIQEQKEFIQGQKNAITIHEDTINKNTGTISTQTEEITNLKNQVSNLQSELEKEKQERATEQANWTTEEEKYKSTIEGLEASMPEVNP